MRLISGPPMRDAAAKAVPASAGLSPERIPFHRRDAGVPPPRWRAALRSTVRPRSKSARQACSPLTDERNSATGPRGHASRGQANRSACQGTWRVHGRLKGGPST